MDTVDSIAVDIVDSIAVDTVDSPVAQWSGTVDIIAVDSG